MGVGGAGPDYQTLMSQLPATGQYEINLLLESYPTHEQYPAEASDILVQQTLATKMLEDISHTKLSVHHTLGVVYGVYLNTAVSGMFNMTTMVSARVNANFPDPPRPMSPEVPLLPTPC